MTNLEDVIECDRNRVDPALLLPYECQLEPSSLAAVSMPSAHPVTKKKLGVFIPVRPDVAKRLCESGRSDTKSEPESNTI